ncbi:MAG: hypothetical protein ACLFV7_09525 [Phycisphaerae bacterium]
MSEIIVGSFTLAASLASVALTGYLQFRREAQKHRIHERSHLRDSILSTLGEIRRLTHLMCQNESFAASHLLYYMYFSTSAQANAEENRESLAKYLNRASDGICKEATPVDSSTAVTMHLSLVNCLNKYFGSDNLSSRLLARGFSHLDANARHLENASMFHADLLKSLCKLATICADHEELSEVRRIAEELADKKPPSPQASPPPNASPEEFEKFVSAFEKELRLWMAKEFTGPTDRLIRASNDYFSRWDSCS